MVKCPNCHERTISRWRGPATCPDCHAMVKESYWYRLVCISVPMAAVSITMNTWFPNVGIYPFISIVAGAALIGLGLTHAFPVFKVDQAPPTVATSIGK